MRKDQAQILAQIQKIQKKQIYLLEEPKTPQQQFLHLFAHRHLLKENMLHKNIQNVMNYLQGSFAQQALKLAYITLCIQNRIQLPFQYSPLLGLIQGWISFYSKINNKDKILLNKIILQQHNSLDIFSSYPLYLTYLNLISVDLWKLIKKKQDEKQMFAKIAIKSQIRLCIQSKCDNFNAEDLLRFVNSCFPKTLLNIILKKQNIPLEMRNKHQNYECLYSNQSAQYFIRTNINLSYLLKHIFIILLSLQLSKRQQKMLLLVGFKYYYMYHYDIRLCAPEIIINCYNRVHESVKMQMNHQFIFFCRILWKLGKSQFLYFIAASSDHIKKITSIALKQPMIGAPQAQLYPYNFAGIGQKIKISRGSIVYRTFEVLEQHSIFYIKIIISNLDLTIRLYYLGEFDSQNMVKIPVLNYEKASGQIRQSINAIKKGLYMFEFDNSYSWIKGKTVSYQNVVVTPLQIINDNDQEWIYDFYQNIYQNQVEDEKIYEVVTNKTGTASPSIIGTASVSKNNNIFTLKLNKKSQQYIYETDNSQKFKLKVLQIAKQDQKYRWTVQNKIVKSTKEIHQFVDGAQIGISQSKRYDREMENEEEFVQQDSDIEYEVVQENSYISSTKQLKQSKKPQSAERGTKFQKKQIESKQLIDYTSEQFSSFYQ